MAYEGWMEFNGTEFINVARLATLSRAMGIHAVRVQNNRVEWIEAQMAGYGFGVGGFGLGPFGGLPDGTLDYEDANAAPWYDAGVDASTEFAGFMPLRVQGLDDSTLTSTPVEYITDGGNSGKPRNATLPIVYSLMAVASTDRGAEYGVRWLGRLLRNTGSQSFCAGADLMYLRSSDPQIEETYADVVHRRDVAITRAISVTKKTTRSCLSLWSITFTLTAADPYEYGEPVGQFASLGQVNPFTEGTVSDSGIITSVIQTSCPSFDYSPIFDPLYPALVPSPQAPNLLPLGWNIATGMSFKRYWARLVAQEPSGLLQIPMIKLDTAQDARMVRMSVWDAASPNDDQCDPLFSVVVSYLPAGQTMYIDSEQKAAYVWDGFSPAVRRTDSLIYSPDANPVRWTGFTNPDGLLVTLDVFAKDGGFEGGNSVRASLALVPKSD